MYEAARRLADRDVVLSDEGTLLLAYLYALSDTGYADSDLEMFGSLAPLPDLVVYVRASTAVLVERSAQRSDRHRQLGGKDGVELGRLIARTVQVFDRLVETRALAGRTLEIDNSADGEVAHARVVDALATCISERRHELGKGRPCVTDPASGLA
jgi:thymidylate kinase